MIVFTHSGGGMKIGWHHGVNLALRDLGIIPDVTGGGSAGALIGAAYAFMEPEEITELLMSLKKKSDVFQFDFWGTLFRKSTGLYSLNPVKDILNGFREKTPKFKAFAVAVSLNTGLKHLADTDHNYYLDFVLASSAIPGYMKPVEIEDQLFCDSGVRDVVPVISALEYEPKDLYIISASPAGDEHIPKWDHKKKCEYEIGLRAVDDIMVHELRQHDLYFCKQLTKEVNVTMIMPDNDLDVGTMEVNPDKMRRIIDQGYEKVMAMKKAGVLYDS